MRVILNARVLNYPLTGVQRYINELSKYITCDPIRPNFSSGGIKAHLWEQLILPNICKGGLLFSPSNTGPISYANQVVTIHDVVPLDHPEWLSFKFAKWYQFLIPRLIRRSRKVITISNFSKERILASCPFVSESKIVVIPNGVDSRFSPQISVALNEDLKKLNLNIRHGKYILSVSSIEPRKNLNSLIKAWVKISNLLPSDIYLVIAGGIGNQSIFKAESFPVTLPRIIFLGRVSDDVLPSLYSGALFFCYLSLYEGFGLPPLEAMACGTPVLVSDRPVFQEVVGDSAMLVDPENISKISEGILALCSNSNLREFYSKKGLIRAALYSWRNCGHQTMKVLDQLL
jgi:glycosyltransferase involved in cell wall biosynthesis